MPPWPSAVRHLPGSGASSQAPSHASSLELVVVCCGRRSILWWPSAVLRPAAPYVIFPGDWCAALLPAVVVLACFGGLVSKSYLAFGIVRNLAGAKALLGSPMLAAATPAGVVPFLEVPSWPLLRAPTRVSGKPQIWFTRSDGGGVLALYPS
ncbi:hypothetical protein VPH35_110488 [Triticum aestivum]